VIELGLRQVGYHPGNHAATGALNQVEPLARLVPRLPIVLRRIGPDEHVDDVLAALVDESRDRPAVEVIQSAADQGEPLVGQVDDGR
jgi:hypothetical protein